MCHSETAREVHCTVRNARQATQIVELLEAARFDRDEISIEFPAQSRREPLAPAEPGTQIHVSVEVETGSIADVHRACEELEEAGAENIVVLPRFALEESAAAAG